MWPKWAELMLWPKYEKYSLDHLKELCDSLERYPPKTHEGQIIDTLKEITQLLVWGDQNNNPDLLEWFFEKNVHWYFLKLFEERRSPNLIVQILQTLNILFENIRDPTVFYFLLSNNYVNQIICHKFDFSVDEILAYFIYFLRTLSFKLDKDTIHFFFNEHLDDFPLYTEAIKFFNSEESLIRAAVRTITLNVYRVNDERMQNFILDNSTAPYFSNLMWFIGNHGVSLEDLYSQNSSPGKISRISYFLAEHGDCLYYVNDIINLGVPKINEVLNLHMVDHLILPLYLNGLVKPELLGNTEKPPIGPVISLWLLSHIFHIIKYPPLIGKTIRLLFATSGINREFGQSNIYRDAIIDFLMPSESDLNVLPALCLIYLACRNQGAKANTLIKTDIYPQKLFRARRILDTLTSPSAENLSDGRRTSTDSTRSFSSRSGFSVVFDPYEGLEPPPLPPRPSIRQSLEQYSSEEIKASPGMDIVEDVKQKLPKDMEKDKGEEPRRRDELISYLVHILCHSSAIFRMITIQMAAELLLELVYFQGTEPCLPSEQLKKLQEAELYFHLKLRDTFSDRSVLSISFLNRIDRAVQELKVTGERLAEMFLFDGELVKPTYASYEPAGSASTSASAGQSLSTVNSNVVDAVRTTQIFILLRSCRLRLLRQRPPSLDFVKGTSSDLNDEQFKWNRLMSFLGL
ncbi:uncharacterized protein VTP21DRAFT_11100 [Calcarisporiella thermophila]|uniref:uncharacterized protein n=1 Tax=Calcarisporiella thermophila TaxID=911321 RepID=UPI003742795F